MSTVGTGSRSRLYCPGPHCLLRGMVAQCFNNTKQQPLVVKTTSASFPKLNHITIYMSWHIWYDHVTTPLSPYKNKMGLCRYRGFNYLYIYLHKLPLNGNQEFSHKWDPYSIQKLKSFKWSTTILYIFWTCIMVHIDCLTKEFWQFQCRWKFSSEWSR